MEEKKYMKKKIYCAGPFFNQQQLQTMQSIEAVLEKFEVDVFKPRDGAASARKLNKDIGAGKDPSAETRRQVFLDNVNNIDDADLVVALIDDRDIGTIFEIGYACKANVPVITFTNQGYGMNLMLAESTLAHCKGLEQLDDAMRMFIIDAPKEQFEECFKRANLSEGKEADKNMDLYKKGQ
jgi:nucleoside deoxyribosyltransferase